jgi:hypothetical protein
MPLHLCSTVLLDRNFSAEIRASTVVVVTESVANGVLRGEDEEFVVREIETELLADVVVMLASFVASTASAVELLAGVNARGGYVAAVLARDGVAGSADWMIDVLAAGKSANHKGGAGEEEEGCDGADGMHFCGCLEFPRLTGKDDVLKEILCLRVVLL